MSQDKNARTLSKLHMQEARTRKRKLQTIASGKVMRELQDTSGFNIRDLTKLAERFTDVSGITGSLEKEQFKSIMMETVPALEADQLARLFEVIDVDHSGSVEFKELVGGACCCDVSPAFVRLAIRKLTVA